MVFPEAGQKGHSASVLNYSDWITEFLGMSSLPFTQFLCLTVDL